MSLFLYVFATVFIFIVIYFLYWFSIPILDSFRDPPPSSYTHTFIDPKTKKIYPFPSLLAQNKNYSHFDSAYSSDSSSSAAAARDLNGHRLSVSLSIIVPAYNEESRLDAMMKSTLEYLSRRVSSSPSFCFELILVDDGSGDRTSERGLIYSSEYGVDAVRVMKLKQNQGKGGAVQQGMLHARGERLLFCDADGATEFKDLEALEQKLNEIEAEQKQKQKQNQTPTYEGGVVVGSRAHYERDAVARRAWYRNILMYGFHFLVSFLCPTGIQDTQCGFKLFSRSTAVLLFATQHLRRWCFDVELLYVAKKVGMDVREVAVNWQEIPGSKLKLLEASLLMGRDLCVIRGAYMFGLWKIRHNQGKKQS